MVTSARSNFQMSFDGTKKVDVLAKLLLALSFTRSVTQDKGSVGPLIRNREVHKRPGVSLSVELLRQPETETEKVGDFDPSDIISDARVAEVIAGETVVIRNAISTSLVDALISDLEGIREVGRAPGNMAFLTGNADWYFLWPRLDASMGGNPSAREQLYDVVEKLRSFLEKKLNTPLDTEKMELSYAFYPVGGWFHRHQDRFRNSGKQREVSFLIYLNKDWREDDGGYLRVYDNPMPDNTYEADENSNYTDFAPEAGTLALFMSDANSHEVLSSNRTRMSIVGWLYERQDSRELDGL